MASTSCVPVGKCSYPQEKEDPEVSGWSKQLFSLYSLRGINACCKAHGAPSTSVQHLGVNAFSIIALTVLLLKNYMMPISFPPTTNGPLWLFKSALRCGSKWEDCYFCCSPAEIFNALKPRSGEHWRGGSAYLNRQPLLPGYDMIMVVIAASSGGRNCHFVISGCSAVL